MPIGAGEAICERYRVWLVAFSHENANSNHAGEVQEEARKVESEKQRQNGEWLRPIAGSILTKSNWKEVASRLCGSINGVSNRVDRNGAIGNSVDPRIVLEIFKAIETYQNNNV
jgi:hypothetical protein